MLRSFVQLTAVGYVIQAIFDSDSLLLVAALLAGMVAFGTFTARGRAKEVPDALGPIALALTVAAVTTLGLILALGVFEAKPRYLVPVGGMVIGNAMTAAAVALNRLADEIGGCARGDRGDAVARRDVASGRRGRGHAQPALGDDHRWSTRRRRRASSSFPGAMTGMLVAGADPLDAVRLQLILLWSLLGSVSLSALIATGLGYRGFFTPAHQLRDAGPR